jgi:hypothetical protein
MRSKLFFSLSVFLAFWLMSTRVSAQEGGGTEIQELNSHPELNLSEDKTLIMEGADTKSVKGTQINRDTNAPSNNAKKQEQQQKPSSNPTNDKTQEDPLSFNFLYFIIQKFKFSDIVDD